jgi:hypothetical protein
MYEISCSLLLCWPLIDHCLWQVTGRGMRVIDLFTMKLKVEDKCTILPAVRSEFEIYAKWQHTQRLYAVTSCLKYFYLLLSVEQVR